MVKDLNRRNLNEIVIKNSSHNNLMNNKNVFNRSKRRNNYNQLTDEQDSSVPSSEKKNKNCKIVKKNTIPNIARSLVDKLTSLFTQFNARNTSCRSNYNISHSLFLYAAVSVFITLINLTTPTNASSDSKHLM